MLTGIVTEAVCQKLMGREISVDDLSGAVSCLLFAFLLPASAPWWLVMLGAALSISLGKMAFGGLGANPVNTALVGWAMLYVSWPALMDPNTMQLDTALIDPLVRLKYFGAEAVNHIDLTDLLLGNQIGGAGGRALPRRLLPGGAGRHPLGNRPQLLRGRLSGRGAV